MFQNAEIWEQKISQAAYVGFHPILSQDPKDFKAGTSVEGWTFNSKLLSCDFLCVFAKKNVLKMEKKSASTGCCHV